MNFEGQNISLADALFVDNITGDLETWRIKSESITRVLVFPPVNNYHRFLVHKVVETGFPEFATFSVGEGADRRTVVCFQQQLFNFTLGLNGFEQAAESEGLGPGAGELGVGKENTSCYLAWPGASMGEGVGELASGDCSLDNDFALLSSMTAHQTSPPAPQEGPPGRRAVAPGRRKRPERAVYQPPSRSQPLNPSAPPYVSPATSPSRPPGLDPTAPAWGSPAASPEPPKCRAGRKKPDRGVYVAPRGRGKQVPGNLVVERGARPGSPHTSTGTGSPTSSSAAEAETEDVTERVVGEITAAVGGVQIEAPLIDYLSFRTSDSTINIDQFGHVIELYDFPGNYTTTDLTSAFQQFANRWDIRWVDDTHALGVFCSSEAAAEALAATPATPGIKARPLNMATAQSKLKARAVCELLLPYKARPATSTAPARRLLQWALGSDKKVPAASKAEQERLREAIRQKEEERRRRRREGRPRDEDR